jgi:hypothetical protein
MAINNNFKKFIEENYIHGYEPDEDDSERMMAGWDGCKDKVFSVLNSLHSVPNTKVSLNEIIALMKEKL